jgi:hypothetical protein
LTVATSGGAWLTLIALATAAMGEPFVQNLMDTKPVNSRPIG